MKCSPPNAICTFIHHLFKLAATATFHYITYIQIVVTAWLSISGLNLTPLFIYPDNNFIIGKWKNMVLQQKIINYIHKINHSVSWLIYIYYIIIWCFFFSLSPLEFLGELTNRNQQALQLTTSHCSVDQFALYPNEAFHHAQLIQLQDFQERNLNASAKNEFWVTYCIVNLYKLNKW